MCAPLTAQFIPESTHDYTTTVGAPLDLREGGADAKSPGDGRTYSVATIEVEQTLFGSEYSNFPVLNPPGLGVTPNPPTRKQVILLQCVDAAGAIQWQRYFFGFTPMIPKEARRPTNARGISVWAGATNEATRIAICGEVYDDAIPLSQAPLGFPQPVSTATPDPTGFIAVYNGLGDLLWTHHFFGAALPNPVPPQNQPDCAITDVSIRVEGEGETLRDVVTYCGISSYGNPGSGNLWLDPILPFASPGAGLSAGDTDFGMFQWDGIVGRISRDGAAPFGNLAREFHSIVGGPDQDGLFGIAEMEDNRFVAVGSSRDQGVMAPPLGFPFTSFTAIQAWPHQVATILGFDAAPTRLAIQGALEIENGLAMGSFSSQASHASDVIVQARFNLPPVRNTVFVVGTTSDPNFLVSTAALTTPGSDVLQGTTDGFLLTALDVAATNQLILPSLGAVFVGGPGDDGLTGVNSWNEHTDHAQACGYSIDDGSLQVQVASFISSAQIVPLRRNVFGGANDDRPTVMGDRNATDGVSDLPYTTGLTFSDPAGGGIAIDERGRLTIVGATKSPTAYPVAGGGRAYRGDRDAVRTEFDMLPIGVGRTDGTGSVAGGGAAPLPPAGFSGGTTPACMVAPTPFGMHIGEPVPLLQRMLIDYQGANAPGALPVIWTTRPTEIGDVVVGALQFGLPAATPLLFDLAEIWTLNSPIFVSELWLGNSRRPWSIPFTVPLPAAPAQFSVQVACLVLTPFTVAPCGAAQLSTFAGPALFFDY